ncbi:SpoIIAA family protein [Gallaecimonas mangrovi]|uniref:STAS/SEC14 domain-containing protein n=1 Tax=Gallaecimonas mangrovi TaxID=2291597 RepID=UPI000E2023FF|nr:STAS/SEC14 domain-containing protein [Gallaecimonas mangrovi]
MGSLRHGMSIGVERTGDQFFLILRAQGTLTHRDYEVITPLLEKALSGVETPHINALVDMTLLRGWELHAAWDDFQLGLKHGQAFDKIALVGNKVWQQLAAKVGDWFISGNIQYFEDETEALGWLLEG